MGHAVEVVEERTLLTTLMINVDTDQDVIDGGDAFTSLREAIIQANSASDDEVIINLPALTFTLGIQASGPDDATTGDLNITNTNPTIEIRGAGVGSTVIDFRDLGSGFSSRVFDIASDTHFVEISGLTLRGSFNGVGGAIYNRGFLELDGVRVESSSANTSGGGLQNEGSATIIDSVFDNNLSADGGAILNSGTLTVAGSTFSSNDADSGGALYVSGNGFVNVEASTFSGNTAVFDGGAVRVVGGGASLSLSSSRLTGNTAGTDGAGLSVFDGTAFIQNSTIDGNTATGKGGGVHVRDFASIVNSTISGNTANTGGPAGGGIFNAASGTLDLLYTTIALNDAPIGDGGGVANESGGSVIVTSTIIGNNMAGESDPDVDGDFQSSFDNVIETVGSATGFNMGNGDQFADPLLGTLADNGGDTPTHALLPGSPAIDMGTTFPEFSDQRGVPRPQGGSADVGAFESGFQGVFVTITGDIVDGGDGETSLREAIIGVNNFDFTDPTIIVPAGHYTLTRTGTEMFDGSFNDLDINVFGVRIIGSGQLSTIIDASGLGGAGGTGDGRVLENSGFGTVLSDLTIENGDAGSGIGGGIASFGALTLNRVTVEDNSAFDGGGIFAFGALTLDGTTVADNTATNSGGGLLLQGSDPDLPFIRSSSISHNTAGNAGGGIATLGMLTVEDSFIAHNVSGSDGGGIAVDGMSGGSLEIRDSLVRSNMAAGNGGGIAAAGDTEIISTEISSNVSSANAGGVGATAGRLTISASTITDNVAALRGGGVGVLGAEGGMISEFAGELSADIRFTEISSNTASLDGGGIANFAGDLFLFTSAVTDNIAANGGGLANTGLGTSEVVSSTFSGNTATGGGGGLANDSGSLDVTNATITLNTAASGGGIASFNNAPTTVQNSIIAQNMLSGGGTGIDVFADTVITTGRHNVIGVGGFGFIDGQNGDQAGTSGAPLDARLGPLQDNGGFTRTHELLTSGPASPAIDAGSNFSLDQTDSEVDVDQRGAERILGASVDAGAYESGSNAIFVTTTEDVVDGGDGVISLREAIDMANANAGPDTIVLPAGKYELTLFNAGGSENSNASGDLDITDDVTIVGYGMGITIIDGQGDDRVLDIAPGQGGVSATFLDLTIQNGQADSGGGLRAESSTTRLERVEVANNRATFGGGGIDNFLGTESLNVFDSLFHNNQAGSGGAIHNLADPLTVQNSRFENNTALTGDGGAIVSLDAITLITGSQFLQNSAATTGRGGAIFSEDFGGPSETVTISDSRFSGNFAGSGGAVSFQNQVVNITGSEFADLSDEQRFIGSNQATDADGGAIENIGGALTVQESRFRGNLSAGFGGAIINAGPNAVLILEDSVLEGNFAGFMGGGGGLYTDQTATVERTTFSMNSADVGGAIGNAGSLTLINSTLSGNTASSGGGLANVFAAGAMIEFSTITDNLAVSGGGGGILQNGTTVLLRNTIVALNTSATQSNADVQGAFTSNGNNLIGDIHNSTGFPGTGDLIGGNAALAITSFDVDGSGNISVTTSTNHNLLTGDLVRITDTDASTGIPEAHDRFTITVVDADTFTLDGAFSSSFGQSFMENSEAFLLLKPQLGTLQNNTTPPDPPGQGGPSMGGGSSPDEITPIESVVPFTHRPLPGSPVIDAGVVVGGITTDQRGLGFPRNVDGDNVGGAAPDIGAVELFLTSITGRKFDDRDGNGVEDPGEFGLSDVTVYADLNENGILDLGDRFTTTDFNGDYVLDLVPPGTTIIGEFIPPPGPGFPFPTPRQTFPLNPVTSSSVMTLDAFSNSDPSGVATADVNGDGRLDVIYTQSGNDAVTVLRQLSNGFFTFTDYSAGTSPLGVAVADVNNDGFVDIVTANSGSDDITVLLNQGNGTFVPGLTLAVGDNPQNVVTGDFNNDGFLDVAAVNANSNNVTILSGDGMGGLNATPFAVVPVGNNPQDLVTGDVDGDGLLDLATADQGSDQVTLLLNQGGGSFFASPILLPGSAVTTLEAADFDRDGLIDLAVGRPGAGLEDVAVIFNRGSLTSFQIVSAGSVTGLLDVRAVDLDGDGFLDIAATSSGATDNLTLFRSDPATGTFQPGVVSTSGNGPLALAVGDVNNDGRPDFITANPDSDDVTSTLNLTGAHVTNNVTGVVTAGIDFGNQSLASVSGTKFEDRNSNRIFDVFFDSFNSGSPDPLWQNEVGNWNVVGGEYRASSPGNTPLTYTSLPFELEDFEVTFDVNNVDDGGVFLRSTAFDPDEPSGVLLITGAPTTGGTGLYWHIVTNGVEGPALNLVNGLFSRFDDINIRVTVKGDTYSAFVNGSEIPATTLTTSMFSQGRFALYSNSSQTFDNVVLPERGLPGVELFLDLNDNGRQDAFEPTTITQSDDPTTTGFDETGQYFFNNVVPGDARVYEIVPPGFQQTTPDSLGLSTPVTLAVAGDNAVDSLIADLDGDGNNDVVVISDGPGAAALRVFAGTGTRYVTLSDTEAFSAGVTLEAVVAGDIDGDGDLDLAVVNSFNRRIVLFENQGNLNFTQAGLLATAGADVPSDVALADVNGDTMLDVVAGIFGSTGSGVAIFTNNGSSPGSFAFNSVLSVITNAGDAIAVTDLDNDGDPDIAAVDLDQNEIEVFENVNGTFTPAATIMTGSNPRAIAVSDLNDDGRGDLVIARDASITGSAIEVFLGSGLFQYGSAQGFEPSLVPDSLTFADVDNDRRNDLVFTNPGSGEIGVLRGDGFTFAPFADLFSAGAMITGVSTGDVDGDGLTDIVGVEDVAGGAQVRGIFNRFGSAPVSLMSGSSVNVDFGNVQLGTLSGFKFHDRNLNGAQDMELDEEGLEGFTIFLDLDEDGVLSPFEPSTTTDEFGFWQLDDVPINFQVSVAEALAGTGFFQTSPSEFRPGDSMEFDAPGVPQELVTGDIDNDGDLDVAIASFGLDGVLIGLVDPSDATVVRSLVPVAADPVAVRLADVNGDGNLDVVSISNTPAGMVSVALGNGNGTFGSTNSFAAGTSPRSLVVADLDGQNGLDIAVSNDDGVVTVLLDNGAGGFTSSTVPVGNNPRDIITADLNGDTHLDLAVANSGSGSVSILRNNGSGSFSVVQTSSTGSGPFGLAVGDFIESSPFPELLVTGTFGYGVMTNNGATISLQSSQPTGLDAPRRVAVADLDGDGNLDFVIADAGAAATDTLIGLGDGAGGFATSTISTGPLQSGVALGDLTGNGRPDILVSQSGNDLVSVFPNVTGSHLVTLTAGETRSGLNFGNRALPGSISGTKFRDDNENGIQDGGEPGIAGVTIYLDLNNNDVLDGGEPSTTTDSNGFYSLTGLETLTEYTVSEVLPANTIQFAPFDPGFAFSGDVDAGGSPAGIVTGDFDGINGDDIAVTLEDTDQVAVILRQANGMFGMPTVINVGTLPFAIVSADFDGANGLDLAVANEFDGTVQVLLNNGSGVFTPQTPVSVGTQPFDLAVADFDGVNGPDLVTINSLDNTLQILLNNGSGTLSPQTPVGTGPFPSSVAAADFDGDGDQDVAVTTEGDNRLTVFLQTSPGTFTAQAPIVTGTDPARLRVADVDNNLRSDLVVVNQNSSSVTVVLNNSTGGTLNLAAPTNFASGLSGESLALVDVNRDGFLDIATSGEDDPQLSVLLNDQLGGFGTPTLFDLDGTFPVEIAPITLNADGDVDLAITDASFGEILLLTSTTGSHSVFLDAGQSLTGRDFGNRNVNEAPVISVPDGQNLNEDGSLIFTGGGGSPNPITVSDADEVLNPAGSEFIVTLSVSNGTLTLGSVSGLDFGIPDGIGDGISDPVMTFGATLADLNAALEGLTYTPDLDFNGSDTLSVFVDDQGNFGAGGPLSDLKTVMITVAAVNDAPVVGAPGAALNATEDVPFNVHGTGFSVIDFDSGPSVITATLNVGEGTLTVTPGNSGAVVSSGNGTGTVTATGTSTELDNLLTGAGTGTILYDTLQNPSASTTLTVTVNDGGASGVDPGPQGGGGTADTMSEEGSNSVQINMTAVNDPPVATVPGTQSATEDSPLVINGLSVSDIDAGANDIRATVSAGNGTITVSTSVSGGLNAGDVIGNGTASVVLVGTAAEINLTLSAGITYLGNANFAGTDSVTLLVDDQGNTGQGGSQNDSESFDVNVAAINDAPIVTVPGNQMVAEDNAVVINGISVSDVDAADADIRVTLSAVSGTVTVNDSVAMGLSAGQISGNGTTLATLTGSIVEINNTLGAGVTYLGNANFNGAETLSVTADDLGNTGGGVSSFTGLRVGPAARAQFEEFRATLGDTFIDFESLAVGTQLDNELAGQGVTFATISDVNGNPVTPFPMTVDSIAFAPTGTRAIIGRAFPGAGADGRTRYEINFTTPQRRAAVLKLATNSITRFFNGMILLGERIATGGSEFVGFASPSDNPTDWITRIELDGLPISGSRQVLHTDDLFFGTTAPPVPQSDTEQVGITVTAVNDAPVLANIEAGAVSYTENDAATQITNAITVADIDDTNIETATVQVTGNYQNGQDVLSATGLPGGIMASFNDGTGTLTLSGSATRADYQIALRAVTYTNTSDNPNTSTRTVTFTVNDGDANSNTQSRNVTVAAVNDAPLLQNLGGDTLNYSGDGAAVIDQGTEAVLIDVDSPFLDNGSLTVSIPAGGVPGEDVLAIRNEGSGAGQIDTIGTDVRFGGQTIGSFSGGTNGNNLVVTFDAAATPANVSALLRNITYENTSTGDPSGGDRTVRFVVTDGSGGSAGNIDATVGVTPVNDAPTFDPQQTVFSLAENSSAGTVIHTVLVSDVDSPESLTFSFAGGNTGNAFAIDAISGEITVNDSSALDFESVGSFDLNVRVTDSSPVEPTPLTAEQVFTVNLTDVAESFFVGPGAFSTGAVTLVRDGAFLHARLTGTMTDVVPRAALANVIDIPVQARDGLSDELTIDFSGGNPLPVVGVSYDGGSGAGTDSLVLLGGSATAINHTLLSANSGLVEVDGVLISYDGLEPVSDLLVAENRAFFYGSGADSVTFSDGVAADGRSRLTAPGTAETVDFQNPTGVLLIDLGDGNDVFRTTSTDSTFDATVSVLGGAGDDDISATGFTAGGVTIDGGDDNDILGGSPGQDFLAGSGGNDRFFSSPGDDMIDGGEGNDVLNDEIDDGNDLFQGGNGFDLVILTPPGVNRVDIGVVDADTGSLAAVSGMGTSTVAFDGTESVLVTSDIQQNLTVDYSAILANTNLTLSSGEGDFSLNGTGVVNISFFTIGEALVIDGSRGNDTISLIGLSSFNAGLDISGGDGSDLILVPGGLSSGGQSSAITFEAESIQLAGQIRSTSDPVTLNGAVGLTGNTTVDGSEINFGGDVTTGSNQLTAGNNSRFTAPTILTGTILIDGNAVFDDLALIAGPQFTVTGSANFNGVTELDGTVNFGGETIFGALLTLTGNVNAGPSPLRIQADAMLNGGSITSTGLVEAGIPTPTALDEAIDSGGGVSGGSLATIGNGPGDAAVTVEVDGTGGFGINQAGAIFDPVGVLDAASTTFDSSVYFRTGSAGTRQSFAAAATNLSPIRSSVTEANSTFDLPGNLSVTLTQLVEPLFDGAGNRAGSLLTQTYVIHNTGASETDFELIRFLDPDLEFDGTNTDGGGRIVTSNSEGILFATDAALPGPDSPTFTGITGLGGTIPEEGRFDIDAFPVLESRIQSGDALRDLITNDADNDQIIDEPFDVTMALRNLFALSSGETVSYTTHTLFGTGSTGNPAALPAVPVRLTGEGTISADSFVLHDGATLTPEPLIQTSNTVFQAGSGLDLSDTEPRMPGPGGVDPRQLQVSGTLNLRGAVLTRGEDNGIPFENQLLVNKTSQGGIQGTFAGLPEGAEVLVPVFSEGQASGLRSYAITYQGGDGNDVELIPGASISGLVFADSFVQDGIRDDGNEPRVSNVAVDLIDTNGTVIRQTTTAVDGTYSFSGLLSGNYTVRFNAPDLRHFTDRDQGMDDTRDSDPNVLTGEVEIQNLASGAGIQNVDAGLVDTTISIRDASPVNEGNGIPVSTLDFTVELNGRSPHQVTVNARIVQGTDGQMVAQATIGSDIQAFPGAGGFLPVIFNPGQTQQTVTVPIVGDLVQEPDEGFEVRLSSPVQAVIADAVGFGLIRNDDFAAPTVVIGEDMSILESQFPNEPLLEFTIRLEGGTASSDLFISYRTIDNFEPVAGVAQPGVDYRPVNDVAVIPAGQSSVTIRVPVIGDSTVEPDERFTVELTAIDGGESQGVTFGPRTQATATILNDDVPVPRVSIGDASVGELNAPAVSTVRFPVTLDGPSSTDTRITYSTLQLTGPGTATSGTDYLPAVMRTLFIPKGQTSATISITIPGDQIDEIDEVFAVELLSVVQGNVTLANTLAVGTIIDDDNPVLRASLNPVSSIEEGRAGQVTRFTMTVSLSGATPAPVDVFVSTVAPAAGDVNAATPGVDFVPFTRRRVQIPAGRRSATFQVDVRGDAIFEADEFIKVQIVDTTPGILINPAQRSVTGIILDDDAPRPQVSIDSTASTTETRPGLTSVVRIPVRLSSPSTETVTVNFATVPPVPGDGVASSVDDPSTPQREDDFRAATGVLTFAAGQQLRFIQILVNGDDEVEPPETFAVELTGVSANADLASLRTRSVATIFDDDVELPSVSIQPTASVEEPDGEGLRPVNLTLTLDGRLSEDVVVGYTTPPVFGSGAATPGLDYQSVVRDEVVIEAGQTTATVTVLVTGDRIPEEQEQFFVQILDVSSNAQLNEDRQQTEVTILDNDAALPTLSISDASVLEGDPVGPDGVAPAEDPRLDFVISLSSVPTGPVTVEVATSRFENAPPGVANTDGAARDAFATRRILFFDPTITSQTFSVRVEPDFAFEADELVFVNVFNPVGAVLPEDSLQGVGTILNDDFERPTVSITSTSLLEGDTPGENRAVLTATLDADPQAGSIPNVAVGFRTVALSATAGVDFQPMEGVLLFADGSRSQTVEIPIIGDLINESAEEFFVELFDLNDGVQMVDLNSEAFQGIVRIDNDDAPNVRFRIDDVEKREGTGGTTSFDFTVRRIGNSTQASTVQFATSAGTAEAGDDFTGRSGLLTFAANGPDTQTVSIAVVADNQLEEEFETFFVTLSNPTNATVVTGAGQAAGTILDDDQRVFTEDGNDELIEIARRIQDLLARVGNVLDNPEVRAEFDALARMVIDRFGPSLLIIADPVDFLLTDLQSRTIGYTKGAGEVSEVPRSFYSGDGNVELVVIPAAGKGVYGLQLSGVASGEFRSAATLVTADGFSKTIFTADTLSGDVSLALDFTEENALPLRGEVIEGLANLQESQTPNVRLNNNAANGEIAAAIGDVILPDDLIIEDPPLPPVDVPSPDVVLKAIRTVLRGLKKGLLDQMDPNPIYDPESDPIESSLLDAIFSRLGRQALGAPGSVMLDLIEFLTEISNRSEESEGDSARASESDADETSEGNRPAAERDDSELHALLNTRQITKAQREALLWLEQNRRGQTANEKPSRTDERSESRKQPSATNSDDDDRKRPEASAAENRRNENSNQRGDSASQEHPPEEA